LQSSAESAERRRSLAAAAQYEVLLQRGINEHEVLLQRGINEPRARASGA
jgi:hypothetical protein